MPDRNRPESHADILSPTVYVPTAPIEGAGESANGYNHYVELQVFAAQTSTTPNLALNRTPTSSVPPDGTSPITLITDGITDTSSWTEFGGGPQWVDVDLGASYPINDIKLWPGAMAAPTTM